MDIKKKFRKFVFSSESFRETNMWIFNNSEACCEPNICESVFFLYDINEFKYPHIDGFENISKYPYIAIEYYLDNSTIEIVYYYYNKETGEFQTETTKENEYISKIENKIGVSFFESFEHIEIIEYEDWLRIYNKMINAYKKINESYSSVKKAFVKFISKDDKNNYHSFNLKNKERYSREMEYPDIMNDDEFYYRNELYLLDLRPDIDIYVLKHSEIENDGDIGKSYWVYKHGEFVSAAEILLDLDTMKIIDDCSDKEFKYYGDSMTSGCCELDDYLRDLDDNSFVEIENLYKNIEFYDYTKWKKLQNRSINSFKKMNENKKDYNFISWLETKLQRNIDRKIGSGMSGVVYELDNSRIIKLTDIKVIELYHILNKDIKGFVKIYQIGWIYPPKRFLGDSKDLIQIDGVDIEIKNEDNPKIGYVIMEKLDTSIENEIEDVKVVLNNFVFSKRGIERLPEDFKSWIKQYDKKFTITESVILGVIYQLVKKNHIKLIQFLRETYTGLLPEILYEIIDCLVIIKDYYPNWEDVHSGQFGRNRKGELVAFDIGDDNHNIYSKKMELLPKPKNIIKEGKNLKKFKDFI